MDLVVNHRSREIFDFVLSGRVDRTIAVSAKATHRVENYDSLKLTVEFADYWAELPHFFHLKQPVTVKIRANDGTVIFECATYHYVSRNHSYTFYLSTEPTIDLVSGK